MRKITLNEIRSKITAKGQDIDLTVNLFRNKTKEQGWKMQRIRPRDTDEIKALNYLARKTLRIAMANGSVIYDKERRVLSIAEFRRS
jgi:hypothetical protein